jgi:hypothetical protein
MARGRSTFTKRQKEQTRQQKQRDKLERRNQRKQEKSAGGSVDEMAELREQAAAQAALFNVGIEETTVEGPAQAAFKEIDQYPHSPESTKSS